MKSIHLRCWVNWAKASARASLILTSLSLAVVKTVSAVLLMFTPINGVAGVMVRWQSVATCNYFLERGTDLGSQPVFSVLLTIIPGQAGETNSVVCPGPYFYRVGVQ